MNAIAVHPVQPAFDLIFDANENRDAIKVYLEVASNGSNGS